MAFQPLTQTEIENGSILDTLLLTKIKDNFDAHNLDLSNKQTALNSQLAMITGIELTLDSHASSLTTQNNTLITLSDVLNRTVGIGTVRSSMLTPAQFSTEHPGLWLLMNGQSCAGTTYATLTGNTTVPNMVTDGTFPRQAKTGRTLGSNEGDAIRNITGTSDFSNDSNSSGGVGPGTTNSGALYGTGSPSAVIGDSNGTRAGFELLAFDASRVVPTADENRPKNTAFNYFIKVGY